MTYRALDPDIAATMKHRVLSREEERALLVEYKAGSIAARDKLVAHNQKFVLFVARKHISRGLELEDLVSAGNRGLLRALELFDMSTPHKLITYAFHWIRSAIVRTKQNEQLLIRLPTYRYRLAAEDQNRPKVVSYDRQLSSRDDTTLLDMLADKNESLTEVASQRNAMEQLHELIGELSAQERATLKYRFGLGAPIATLQEVGNRLGVSRERIRQIEIAAIRKLKRSYSDIQESYAPADTRPVAVRRLIAELETVPVIAPITCEICYAACLPNAAGRCRACRELPALCRDEPLEIAQASGPPEEQKMVMPLGITEDQLKYADEQNRPPHNRSHIDIGKEIGFSQTHLSRALKKYRKEKGLDSPPKITSPRKAPTREKKPRAPRPKKARIGEPVRWHHVAVDGDVVGNEAESAHAEVGKHREACGTCREATQFESYCLFGRALVGRWARLEIKATASA